MLKHKNTIPQSKQTYMKFFKCRHLFFILGQKAAAMYIPAKYNAKYHCYHVYFPNRQLLLAAMVLRIISTAPLLRVIPSLCITQSPHLFRLYFKVDAKVKIQNSQISEWFAKGQVNVYGIGPVVDRATNARSNMFFILVLAAAANKCLQWDTEEGKASRKYNGYSVTVQKAIDARVLKKARNQRNNV